MSDEVLDTLFSLMKVAASGERPHEYLPGRTSKTVRSGKGTRRPVKEAPVQPTMSMATAEPEEPESPKVKKPKAPRKQKPAAAPTVEVATGPGGPKLDLQFSIKLGSEGSPIRVAREKLATKPSTYTGARVDGGFDPSPQVTGDYGHSMLSEEENLMKTPALPDGEAEGVPMMNVKVSTIVDKVLQKVAAPQPTVPIPDEVYPTTQPGVSDSILGETLGVLGGGGLGVLGGGLLARKGKIKFPTSLIPIGTGAAAGAGLGGMAGHRIEKAVRGPETEGLGEEQALQALLHDMKKQNPQFYQRLNEEQQ